MSENISRAEIMLKYVPPYYSESKHYLAQNNAKGEEFDIIQHFINDIPNQVNPQTATWGIWLWEEFLGLPSDPHKSLGNRRTDVLAKYFSNQTITPIALRRMFKSLVDIDDLEIFRTMPYVYVIRIMAGEKVVNYSKLIQVVEEVKPAHLSFLMQGYFIAQFQHLLQIQADMRIQSGFYARSTYNKLFLEGSWNLDGTYHLDGNKVEYLYQVHPANLLVESEVDTDIRCDNLLTVEKNLYYLDGSCYLDGEKTLDAEVIFYEEL